MSMPRFSIVSSSLLLVVLCVGSRASEAAPESAHRQEATASSREIALSADRVDLRDEAQSAAPADVAVCTGRISDRRLFVLQHAQLCVLDTGQTREVQARFFDDDDGSAGATVVISTDFVRVPRSDDLLHYEFGLNQAGFALYGESGENVLSATVELWLAPRHTIRTEGALRQHFVARMIERFVPRDSPDQEPPRLYHGLHFYSADGDDMPLWGYHGEVAPNYWADLSGSNEACDLERSDQKQSPVALAEHEMVGCGAHAGELEEIVYRPGHVALVNNGHTVLASFSGEAELKQGKAASQLKLNSKGFGLLQFHLHVPAEHVFVDREGNRKVPDGELHLVHRSQDGEIAVLSLLLEESEVGDDPLAHLLEEFPARLNEPVELSRLFDPERLIAKSRAGGVYRYEGSLTTPPCTENVHWAVFRQPLKIGASTLEQAARIIGGANARRLPALEYEVPYLNGRTVMACDAPGTGEGE